MKTETRDAITELIAKASHTSTTIGAVGLHYSVEQLTAFVAECWDIASGLDRSAAKLQRLVDLEDWQQYVASHPTEVARSSQGGAA
jgi:hypothetical protein